MTTPHLEDGDVIIRRCGNGWIVEVVDTREDRLPDRQVYEAADGDINEALARALCETFDGYTRRKHQPGLVIEVRPSHEDEDAEHEHDAPAGTSIDVGGMEADAVAVVRMVVERLRMGRGQYGALRLESDGRDMRREMMEELLDASVYGAAELVRGRE